MGATDHEIYKKRGKMNAQIGLLLAAIVVMIIIGTIARRYDLQHAVSNDATNNAVNEAQVNEAQTGAEQAGGAQ